MRLQEGQAGSRGPVVRGGSALRGFVRKQAGGGGAGAWGRVRAERVRGDAAEAGGVRGLPAQAAGGVRGAAAGHGQGARPAQGGRGGDGRGRQRGDEAHREQGEGGGAGAQGGGAHRGGRER